MKHITFIRALISAILSYVIVLAPAGLSAGERSAADQEPQDRPAPSPPPMVPYEPKGLTFGAPVNLLSLGPSLGYMQGEDFLPTLTVGLDLAYSPVIPVWVSLGLSGLVVGEEQDLQVYAEAGLNLFVNLGFGYTLSLLEDPGKSRNIHGFLGMPIPIDPNFKTIIEPYLRPCFDIFGEETRFFVEGGLMLKFLSF